MNRKHVLLGVSTVFGGLLLVVMCRATRHSELFHDSYFAIEKGDGVQLQKLLQQGAPPDGIDGAFIQGTPLSWSAERGDVEMMRMLIQSGAHVNKQTPDGATALMGARYPYTVQFLLNAGANPLLRTEGGTSAWDIMKTRKDEESAAILQKAAHKWRATHKNTLPKNH